MPKEKIRWTDYNEFELLAETTSPIVATQPVLDPEECDEKGKKKIAKMIFSRNHDGKPSISPKWIAGMLDVCATRDLWKLSSVKTTLSSEAIEKLFGDLRLAGMHIQKFFFYGSEIVGTPKLAIERFSISFKNQKGQRVANIFDAEVMDTETPFKIRISMPAVFQKHVLTLLEIGSKVVGIGNKRNEGNYGRFKVVSFKEV